MTQQLISPVRLTAVDAPDQPTPTPELEELYRGFEEELLVPLWTEIGDLMPLHPQVEGGAAPVALEESARRWPAAPVTWCRSAAAASGARSRWPTRPGRQARTPRRRCGPRSST